MLVGFHMGNSNERPKEKEQPSQPEKRQKTPDESADLADENIVNIDAGEGEELIYHEQERHEEEKPQRKSA